VAGNQGDIVQVTLKGTFDLQTILNVFFYRCLDFPTPGYLTGILTEFQSVVLPAIAGLYFNDFALNSLQALNIFTGDVLEDNTLVPATGSRGANAAPTPPFVAGMILLVRENNRVRHGRKFFICPSENDLGQNAFLAAWTTLLQAAANTMDQNLFPGGTDEFAPVIVGRVKYVTPQGKNAYRLPESQVEMDDNWSVVSDARAIDRPTTMNSRKVGRGI